MYQYCCCVSDCKPRSASPLCQWHSHSAITVGYTAANTSSTVTRYLPRPEVHSTCRFCSFFCLFVWLADLGNRGHPAVWLLQMPLSLQTLLAIPPLHPHDSLSLHHLYIQGCHLYSLCQLSHLSLNLLLLYERLMGASSLLYFWDHHTPIQIVAKPTEALDTAHVYLSLANPMLKLEVCRNPGSSQLKLSASWVKCLFLY